MRMKPKVCLIDEDPQVKTGWERALSTEAELNYYQDYRTLFEEVKSKPDLISSFDCVIISRFLAQGTLDVFESNVTESLRSHGVGAIFLNWQGYLTKEEISSKFDGRLFNRYGVRWQTLRARIQKIKNKKTPVVDHAVKDHQVEKSVETAPQDDYLLSRPQRCQEVLKDMAKKAVGQHREKLEYLADHDSKSGIELLEAIYNRLLTVKESPQTCPSRYINSSPVVAKNILQKALFG